MRLIHFMMSQWSYGLSLVFSFMVLVWLPYLATVFGTTYQWELVLAWCFAPVPMVGLFIGAWVHLTRLHIRALEASWYEANHNLRHYPDEDLARIFLHLRKTAEPW